MTNVVAMQTPDEPVRVEKITPELAHHYLGFNTHNRNLRSRVVSAYAADMKSGNWDWNGESIKFASDGTLLDGQHRLAAILEAGVTVPMLVIRGLPARTQETMDGGAKRKFADVLNLRGEKHYVTLAAAIRSITEWNDGGRFSTNKAFTNAQLLATLEANPWIRDGLTTINLASSRGGLPARVGGLLWWLTQRIDTEDSDYFFERLSTDENHHSGEPIYELRKVLQNSTSVRGERSARFLAAVSIKAWNKYRDGESVGQLKFRSGGAKPETFPEPR